MSGETLSLWMRDPDARHAWMRIVKGADPQDRAARRVFVEKTPRVHDPAQGEVPTTPADHPRCSWIGGPKGHADDGDGPDLGSRRWADEKARELGYVLPDMQAEIAALKSSWYADGGWDLEDSEGFEAHRDELLAYRKQAERRAKEHEEAIVGLMRPALDFLPEKDERGGLTRGDASRDGHAANRLLRAVAEMLLPIVQRLDHLDERQETELRKLEEHVDQQVRRLDGR